MSICCGNQNRRLTVFDDNPPRKTANCYISGDVGENGVFNPNQCNEENSACSGQGIESGSGEIGCNACKPSSDGGFCQIGTQYFSSYGGLSHFREMEDSEVRSLFKTSTTDSEEIATRKVLKDYDRRMKNKIREMQIMGKDVFNTNSDDTIRNNTPNNTQNNNTKKTVTKTKSSFNYYYLIFIIPSFIAFLYLLFTELKKKYPNLKIFKLLKKN